jgi:hypothetical protein
VWGCPGRRECKYVQSLAAHLRFRSFLFIRVARDDGGWKSTQSLVARLRFALLLLKVGEKVQSSGMNLQTKPTIRSRRRLTVAVRVATESDLVRLQLTPMSEIPL